MQRLSHGHTAAVMPLSCRDRFGYDRLWENRMAEAPVEYIKSITRQYAKLGYKPYGWVYNTDAPPWQPLRKPLKQSRVALIASGGIYRHGQTAFHSKDDTSLRLIPTNVRTEDLRTSHFAYDQTDARKDPNVVFPIDTLRGLVREGFIGGLTEHAFTFMGGIYSSRRVREEVAPAITDRLVAERADLALLVPV
jgi:D-proline reductase (dithiol) PrdB